MDVGTWFALFSTALGASVWFYTIGHMIWSRRKRRLKERAEALERELDQKWWDALQEGDTIQHLYGEKYEIRMHGENKYVTANYYFIWPRHRANFTHIQDRVPW